MGRGQKSIFVMAVIAAFITGSLFMLCQVVAGELEPSGPPTTGTMHTIEEIYNLIVKIGTAPVEKTGQTVSYSTGDDGDYEKGIGWPVPRFTDNGDGTVTDNLTGLIWLKNANCFGTTSWAQALADCNTLANGDCGLTDGSLAGDWRLPNIKELQSIIDYGQNSPALPPGHPFTDVQTSNYYWSSTSSASSTTNYAWGVHGNDGTIDDELKVNSYWVWPVCGGN